MGFVQNIESIAVANAVALICTSNVHTVAGSIGERHGLTLGHEAVGAIHELSDLAAASGLFEIGPRVAINAVASLAPIPPSLTDEQAVYCCDIISTGFVGPSTLYSQLRQARRFF